MAYPSLFEQLDSALGATFRLERELGGGGMSRVFLAEDRELGRRVVVKVLPPELTTELSADRFRREVLIAARLQHPNIVPVLTAGQAGSVMYYAMPFVEGETLRARLLRECARGARGLPLEDVVRILRDVARAMGYAHRQGVVHRDIKPENVLLSDDGVLVTDFGIAKAMTDAAKLGAVAALTIDGRAIGTVEYMPPEQAVGDPETDHRADIYASGVLAYEMLTGRPPYTGRSAIEVLAAQAVSDPVPVERRRQDVPPALATLVTRCLHKRAADRPASADEIIKALDTATNGGAARFGDEGASVRRRRRVLAAALVTALLVVSTVAVARIPDERRAVLTTLLRRGPPVLRPQRYFVATFENHTGDARFDQWGFLIAGSVAKALVTVPNIEVVDARTRQINEKLVDRFPWPMTGDQRKRAAAREAGAGMLIAGSLFLDGDSLRVRTTMSDIATGALAPSVQDVFGPAAHPDTLVARLSNRIAAAIGMSADTGVVARVGDYSDAASPAAYDALRRGMEAYFAHDTSMYRLLREAERLDTTWVTPTMFLAYIDAWNQRPTELARDLAHARRLVDRMTLAEQGLFAYVQALSRNDLPAMLPAARQFMRNTPGSMESPLLVSSTALGLREPAVADSALRGVDPDRGLNLVGPYYWQSRIGLAQMRGDARAVLDAAHEGERRFPRWILFRAYEARELARQGRLDEITRVILAARMDTLPQPAARTVVAAHAASALAMRGRAADARELAQRWWPAATAFRADTARWIQEAVANLALLGEEWHALTTMDTAAELTSAHALSDRMSYAAVGRIHLGDTAAATRYDALLAAKHPPLDFGHRELARARIAAHRGQHEHAVRLLRQAAAEGVRLHLLWGIDFMSDPFLAPLRELDSFRQLVGRTDG